jgi:hypothetical protein
MKMKEIAFSVNKALNQHPHSRQTIIIPKQLKAISTNMFSSPLKVMPTTSAFSIIMLPITDNTCF